MQKISPFLWFESQAEEAVTFYTSLFKNSKITSIQKYPDNVDDEHMKGMEGKVLNAIFELNGYQFMALDGGPLFQRNPSISFILNFDPKYDENAMETIGHYWGALSEGGTVLMEFQEYPFSKKYGWIQDKFGVSWQLILTDPEGEDRPFITPSLMFVGENTGKAEEAIHFYTSVFKDSKLGSIARYPAGMEPDKEGTIMFSDFTLANQWFAAMDSAREHAYTFNEAISLYVECADQAEIDYLWEKLSAVPQAERCGWLKDKFGVAWQIIPRQLGEYMASEDKEQSARVMKAMLQMKKMDIAELERAYNG